MLVTLMALLMGSVSMLPAQSFVQVPKSALFPTPLFTPNVGQISGHDADRVKFVYPDNGFTAFLLDDGIAYQFSNSTDASQAKLETYRMDMQLIGANATAQVPCMPIPIRLFLR